MNKKLIEGTHYSVSEDGKVWNEKFNKQLKGTPNAFGHLTVCINGKTKKIHRLVYQAFVGAIPKGYDIHHKDFNKNNNSVSNLICITHKEHARLHSDLREPTEQQLKNLQKGRKEKLSEEHKAKIAASKKAWWDKVKNK